MEVPVRVSDPSAGVLHDVLVDAAESGSVQDLIDAIVDTLGWPRLRVDRTEVSYCLIRPGRSEPLDPHTPIRELDLEPGIHLVIAPR